LCEDKTVVVIQESQGAVRGLQPSPTPMGKKKEFKKEATSGKGLS